MRVVLDLYTQDSGWVVDLYTDQLIGSIHHSTRENVLMIAIELVEVLYPSASLELNELSDR